MLRTPADVEKELGRRVMIFGSLCARTTCLDTCGVRCRTVPAAWMAPRDGFGRSLFLAHWNEAHAKRAVN
jgi:hypothetical protein